MEIKFRGALTKELYIRALAYKQRVLRRYGFAMAGLGIALLAWTAFDGGLGQIFGSGPGSTIGSNALLLLVVGICFTAVPWAMAQQTWKSDKRLSEPTDWVFDECTVHMTSEFGQINLPWDRFDRVEVGDDLVLLYPQKNLAHVVFRDFMSSDLEWDQLKAWCGTKVPKASRFSWPLKAMLIWVAILALVFLALKLNPSR